MPGNWRSPPKWKYTDCLCGMLIRCGAITDEMRAQMKLPGPVYVAECPGCKHQVSIGFAPPSPIIKPGGPAPGPVPA